MEVQSSSESDSQPEGNPGEVPFGNVPQISEALGRLQEKLQDLDAATAHIEESQEAAKDASEAANEVRSAAEDLVESTTQLVNRIDEVDFPARLNEIERAVEKNRKQIDESKSQVTSRQKKLATALNSLNQDLDALRTQVLIGLAVVGLIALAATVLPLV